MRPYSDHRQLRIYATSIAEFGSFAPKLFSWHNTLQLQIALLFRCVDQMNRLQNRARLIIGIRRSRSTEKSRGRRRRRKQHPYHWSLPPHQESWFEIHYRDPNVPGTFFRGQFRLDKRTFELFVDELRPQLTRQDTRVRNCISTEKIIWSSQIGTWELLLCCRS